MAFCQNCGSLLSEAAAPCRVCAGGAATIPQVSTAAAASPTNSGLQPNVAGALTYLVGFVTGILFLVVDPYKNDRFVRFHAFQSIFFNVAWIAFWIVWMIVGFVLGALTKGLFFLIELPVNLLLTVGGFCLWAFLMYSGYVGKTFKLPIIGAIAAQKAEL